MEQILVYADRVISFSQAPETNLTDFQTGLPLTLEEFVNASDPFRTMEFSASEDAALFNPGSDPDEDNDALVLTTGSSISLGFSEPITLEQAGINVPSLGIGSLRADGLRVEVRPEGGELVELTVAGSGSNYSFLNSPLGDGPITVVEIRLTATAPDEVSGPFIIDGYRLLDNIELVGVPVTGTPPDPEPPLVPGGEIAIDDLVEITVAEQTLIDVLGNDNVPSGTNPFLSISSLPDHGQAFAQNGQVHYRAPERVWFEREDGERVYSAFSGEDRFSYAINFADGGREVAEVVVNIDSPDLALVGEAVPRLVVNQQVGGVARTWQDGDVILLNQQVTNFGAPIDLDENGNRPIFEFSLSPVSGVGSFNFYSLLESFFLQTDLPDSGAFGTNETYTYAVQFGVETSLPDYTGSRPGYYTLHSGVGTMNFLERGTANNISSSGPDAQRILVTDRSLFDLTIETLAIPQSATAQNDTIINNSGVDQTVDGGAGRDTFVSDTTRDRAQLIFDLLTEPENPSPPSSDGSDDLVLEEDEILIQLDSSFAFSRALSTDEQIRFTDQDTSVTTSLQNVERIALADGVYVFDLEGDDLEYAYRIYDAAFGRTPDESGLTFWNDQMELGNVTRESLAQFFVDSPEFASLYPSATDEEFITALYANALRRAPDEPGFEFWSEVFATGELSRADMLVFFADSPENIERNASNYDDGLWLLG